MTERQAVIPKGFEVQYDGWKLSPALRVGCTIYCSGQIGIGMDGTLPADPREQFTLAFENVKAVLEAAGASFADVVEISSFHVGLLEHLEAFMGVRDRYIGQPYPAQTAVGVAELAMPGALVEIRATAVLRG